MAYPTGQTPEFETGAVYIGNGQPTFEIAPPVTYEGGFAKIGFDALRRHLNAFSDPDGTHGAEELFVYIPTPAPADEAPAPSYLTFYNGQVQVDTVGHCVYFHGQPVELRNLTYRTLAFLGRNAGMVMTPHQIIEDVWGVDGLDTSGEAVKLQIMQIRRKLEHGVIENVKRLGYRAVR